MLTVFSLGPSKQIPAQYLPNKRVIPDPLLIRFANYLPVAHYSIWLYRYGLAKFFLPYVT